MCCFLYAPMTRYCASFNAFNTSCDLCNLVPDVGTSAMIYYGGKLFNGEIYIKRRRSADRRC